MTKEKMKNTADKLLKKYGEDKEKLKILEELTELSQEIWRDINHSDANRRKILEERIDVELMLHMIDSIYNFSDETRYKMWELKQKKIDEKYLETLDLDKETHCMTD